MYIGSKINPTLEVGLVQDVHWNIDFLVFWDNSKSPAIKIRLFREFYNIINF